MEWREKAQIEKAKRELSRRHLLAFTKYNYFEYQENWHHILIADALEAVERGEIKRLMIFLPPRHGKSELASIQFPAWYLGRNPRKQIISVNYSADLAKDFGRKVRNVVLGQEYRNIFPETVLSMQSKAADKWMTKVGGSYYATGIGGSITGKGANCFVAGTSVSTELGNKKIENLQYGDRVLSFNHGRNIFEYKPIIATQRIVKKRFAEVATSNGGKITGTMDHPIFVVGKGYVKIQNLKIGGKVWVYKVNENSYFKMHALPERIQSYLVRLYKASSSWARRHVLFNRVFKESSCYKKSSKMHRMRKTVPKKDNEILFKGMQVVNYAALKKYSVQFLWRKCKAVISIYKILFHRMQERFSFFKNEWAWEFQFSTWNGDEKIPKGILSNKEKNNITRWWKMFSMWDGYKTLCPSQGLQSKKQYSGKSYNSMQHVPHSSSQFICDTISSITPVDKWMEAYDIQIEGNENFLANGILVHNCLIIDDPMKSRKEADSALIREQTYSWYRGTAYTRLAPDGAVILIMTRWQDGDLAGRLLSKIGHGPGSAARWHIINLPAIATQDEVHTEFGRTFTRGIGEPLWPARYSLEKLMSIKETIGPYEWSSQYQQNPVDEDSIEFKKDWFKDRSEEEVEKLNTLRYLTVDTAGRMKQESNYIGMVDNRVDVEGNWNISARKFKMDPGFFADYLFTLQEKYHFEMIGIEKTIFYEGLEPYISKKEMETGITLPIFELKHGGNSKQLRIRGLIPYYKNGKIYHIEGKCEDLIPQLMRFPKSDDDDIIDALAYQTQIAKAPFGWTQGDFPERDPERAQELRNRDKRGFDPHSPIGELDI